MPERDTDAAPQKALKKIQRICILNIRMWMFTLLDFNHRNKLVILNISWITTTSLSFSLKVMALNMEFS